MPESKSFIATVPLFVGTARAHNPGDVVPADNVKEHGWEDGVAREGTKAADTAAGVSAEDAAPLPSSAQGPAPK